MPFGHGPRARPPLQIHGSRSIYAAPIKAAIEETEKIADDEKEALPTFFIAGRFLSTAVFLAAALTFSTRFLADPGTGAVVTHIDFDATSQFTAISQDVRLRLDVTISGQATTFASTRSGRP